MRIQKEVIIVVTAPPNAVADQAIVVESQPCTFLNVGKVVCHVEIIYGNVTTKIQLKFTKR